MQILGDDGFKECGRAMGSGGMFLQVSLDFLFSEIDSGMIELL